MKIGDKASSRLYSDKGIGTILGFTDLFGETYVELLFQDGEKISTSKADVLFKDNLLTRLQNSSIDDPSAFLARNMVLRLHTNLSENKIITSANYKIQPLPHQLLAVHFVMNRYQPRSLIADEVGLGKTIEAILLYQEYKMRNMVKKVLIIAPSGLLLQWHEELLSKFNEQFIIYNKEYIRTLKQSYGKETNVWKLHDKVIVSMDSIKPQRIHEYLDPQEVSRREWHNRHVFEDIASAGFDMVIFDEAHKLSKHGDGFETARFKLGQHISDSVPVFLLLTATPHQGDEDMFINLLRLIDPVLFANKKNLSSTLVQEVSVRNKKRAVVDFEGNRIFKHRITSLIKINRTEEENHDELELYSHVTKYTSQYYNLAKRTNNQFMILLMILYQRILTSSSFAIRQTMKRRKAFLEEGIKEIEESENYIFDLDDIQHENILYQKIAESKKDLDAEKSFVDKCIQLAQKIASVYGDIKFKKLIEVIEEIKKRERKFDIKFIIFTEFRATQSAIIEFLKKFGYECSYINGSLSREERVDQVELFRTKNQIMVSTDAGGEGINLQFCYCIINYDLPWNPSRLEQRIGRIDRIGQNNNCLIFNFHLTDTVEDRVRRILEVKLEKIKQQFGEDKYTDVLTLLQGEFSFDKIYIDAIQIKNAENEVLNDIADQIYNRAKQVLEKDDLLIPFSSFSEDAKQLLNIEVNHIIKNLVINYLANKHIDVSWYKEEKDLCFFNNPFPGKNIGPKIYRNVTFDNVSSYKTEKIEFINIEHPLVSRISKELDKSTSFGTVCALRLNVNKFSGVFGLWFIYKLIIRNNVDRAKSATVNIFMEDKDFCNNRISNYLENNIIEEVAIIQNFSFDKKNEAFAVAALNAAKEKANDIFAATKLTWLEEITKYEKKTGDYFQFKKNAIENIRVENIKKSKLKSLDKEKMQTAAKFQMRRNIVPKLDLYQVAYMEFV